MLIELLMKMLMFWNDLFKDDMLLCWRILNLLCNVDWVVDENVIFLKWLVWGWYIIASWWILNRPWNVDWAVDENVIVLKWLV
jgi:hypothetical protein